MPTSFFGDPPSLIDGRLVQLNLFPNEKGRVCAVALDEINTCKTAHEHAHPRKHPERQAQKFCLLWYECFEICHREAMHTTPFVEHPREVDNLPSSSLEGNDHWPKRRARHHTH